MENVQTARIPAVRVHRKTKRRNFGEKLFWYIVLVLVSIGTVFPFLWIFLTAFKGPLDAVYSTPPQFIPHDPTSPRCKANHWWWPLGWP